MFSGVLPSDPLVQKLNPFQIEAFRHVKAKHITEEREFWLNTLSDFTPKFINALSVSIINKLCIALNGGDISAENGESQLDTSVLQNLAGTLSEEDLTNLKSAGIDISKLSTIESEVV